ncbi:ATPaseAAA-typecore [Penicillium sp. IBT 31633x]|nr:ATPaseAAA-typecore [Penicillium sp. IBT 31633x]
MHSNISEVLPAAFESMFPGFSLFTRLLSSFLRTDVSSYYGSLVLFAALSPFFGFILPRFLDNVQNVLLYFTVSTEIPYHDKLHNQFIQWMERNDSLSCSRRSIAKSKNAISLPWQNEDDEDTDEDPLAEQERFEKSRQNYWFSLKEQQNIKPIRGTPSHNKLHFFLYQGCLIALYRRPYEKQNSWLANAETFTIYSFFWNKKMLFTLLKEVQQASIQRHRNKITIYRGFNQKDTISWVPTVSKPPRSLSTLALPIKMKNDMIEDIEDFLNPQRKVWYESRGIPYRRGYLLYGPPGTGKSSMCFAIAGLLWLDIYTVSLNSRKLDEDSLIKLFQSLPKRCIMLLEDVDSAGISQECNWRMKYPSDTGRAEDLLQANERDGAGISLSALLNCLDGVAAQEGRILIMTTNHLEKLDTALIRPGRVDKRYHFDFVNTMSVKQLFRAFFDEGSSITTEREPSDRSTWENSVSELSDKFADIILHSQLTAAEINNYLMGFRENPEMAVSNAFDWIVDRRIVSMPTALTE